MSSRVEIMWAQDPRSLHLSPTLIGEFSVAWTFPQVWEKTLSHEAYRSRRRFLLIGIIGVCEHSSDFFNWNRVFVRYCDGASFSGNGSLPTDSKVSHNSSSPYFLVSALISVELMSVSLHLPAHFIDTRQLVRKEKNLKPIWNFWTDCRPRLCISEGRVSGGL